MSYQFSLRSAFAPIFVGLAMLGAATFTNSTAQAASSDPAAEAFVKTVSEQAIGIISNDAIGKQGREAAFSSLLDENADMQKIAAFCLGQFLRTPTEAEKTEYLDTFKKFVVKIYLTRLADYSNEKLTVTGSQPKGANGALVQSQINFTDGREPVKVTWWLIKKDGNYKLFDLNVVGVWLAQEQRSSFTSVINNNGGKFAALLTHLNKQIAEAETGKLPPVAKQQ